VIRDEQFFDGATRLCYTVDGDASHPTVLLVAGLGQQLHAWPPAFIEGLIDRGFQVMRFDNRDVGRSSQSTAPPPKQHQLVTRRFGAEQYTIDDMAADAAELVGGLGIGPVHAVGVSMGGMISQNLAAQHPRSVASLTSIMSMTGKRNARPALSTLKLLSGKPARTEQEHVDQLTAMMRHIGSAGYEFDEASWREVAILNWDRGPGADAYKGVSRQLAAIMKSGDRTKLLADVDAPTLVINGDRDLMVNPRGGATTAKAIRGARHEVFKGMGHDLPAGLVDQLVDLIASHATAAEASVVRGAAATA
jgi:pimeloyl-ACP methyl ester carboxylesterase